MNRFYSLIFGLFLCFIMHSCDNEIGEVSTANKFTQRNKSQINLLSDINPDFENGVVNAVVEIPSGTLEKWEVNKASGQVSWEKRNNAGRVVNYLGYPGNYGMIYNINSITELNQKYIGISRILEIWFSNYKGPKKMISNGFRNLNHATEILNLALDSYNLK